MGLPLPSHDSRVLPSSNGPISGIRRYGERIKKIKKIKQRGAIQFNFASRTPSSSCPLSTHIHRTLAVLQSQSGHHQLLLYSAQHRLVRNDARKRLSPSCFVLPYGSFQHCASSIQLREGLCLYYRDKSCTERPGFSSVIFRRRTEGFVTSSLNDLGDMLSMDVVVRHVQK